jgi:hypothetical protein
MPIIVETVNVPSVANASVSTGWMENACGLRLWFGPVVRACGSGLWFGPVVGARGQASAPVPQVWCLKSGASSLVP